MCARLCILVVSSWRPFLGWFSVSGACVSLLLLPSGTRLFYSLAQCSRFVALRVWWWAFSLSCRAGRPAASRTFGGLFWLVFSFCGWSAASFVVFFRCRTRFWRRSPFDMRVCVLSFFVSLRLVSGFFVRVLAGLTLERAVVFWRRWASVALFGFACRPDGAWRLRLSLSPPRCCWLPDVCCVWVGAVLAPFCFLVGAVFAGLRCLYCFGTLLFARLCLVFR